MSMKIASSRNVFKSSFSGMLRWRVVAAALLVCMSGCATSGSQVALSREEHRETMKKAGLGMIVTTLAGLGATYAGIAYDHRDLAAGTAIGTLVIDLILVGIVMINMDPCSFPSNGSIVQPCP